MKTPANPDDEMVFYKIRDRRTGLFKTSGRYGWSKSGKTWNKNSLAGHMALFKCYEDGGYSIPESYEIVQFSSQGTVVALETVLPQTAIVSPSKA